MPGMASLVVWKAAVRFTASSWSHFSTGNFSMGATNCIPGGEGRGGEGRGGEGRGGEGRGGEGRGGEGRGRERGGEEGEGERKGKEREH